MSRTKRIILGASLVFTFGCDGFQNNSAINQLGAVSEGLKTGASDKPYCEVDFVDYELDTHLLAFEITDRNNIGFGFNLVSGFFRALGLSIKTESGKMLASMHLREALRPTESVVDVLGRGESKKTEFNMELDLVQLGLDLGYFRQTPLNSLTQKTMAQTLKNLKAKLAPIETTWSSRVVHTYPADSQMIIPAGSIAGIRIGDQFQIYNVDYTWEDKPCESTLTFRRKRTTQPIAILQVTQLEKNASLLTIVERPSDQNIEEGAIVEIYNLPLAKKEKSRSLARSIRLTSFQSEKLSVPGAKDVDLTLYLSEQTAALLTNYGFYPRK